MEPQDTNLVSNIVEKGRADSIKAISLLGAVAAWIALAACFFAGLYDSHYYTLVAISATLALSLSLTNFLANRNKTNLAIWLSLFIIEVTFIAVSFTLANLGIILAVILLIITGNLALQSLPTKTAMIAFVSGIIASATTLLVDILTLNPMRINPPGWLTAIAIIAGGIIILILGIQLLRHYQFNSIRTQIITAFLIINVIPIWIVAATQLIEPADNQARATIFIATIVMLVALIAAVITSNSLTSPLNYLTAVSERIKLGELDIPIKLDHREEIGKLSEMLTATATELKQIQATLENRVQERTADLVLETENSKQFAKQISSIVEITRTITSIQNFNELLPEITRQINAVLGFYHVGVFLIDQNGQYAVLQASNSEGGQKMIEKGYRLKVGHTDIIGFVTGSGQPHIALDSGEEPVVFNNPDLPDTRSEITIPLRNGENIIGALDIQSTEPSAFTSKDIDNLTLLANQISIAIQNARLFEETRNALTEAQVFYRQSATASWREVLRQGTRGYRYLNGSIEAIKTVVESPQKTGGQNAEKKGTGNISELLTIPINIRGKNLGTLNIRQIGRKHPWSNSEIHIYQSIVDRISFALENARLYQDAQRRAAKERVISEIATKVSSSVNMDNILQTAVEELGRVLPGFEVVVQFDQEDETGA